MIHITSCRSVISIKYRASAVFVVDELYADLVKNNYNLVMYVRGAKHLSITSTYLQPVSVKSQGSPKSLKFFLLFSSVLKKWEIN